MATKPRSEWTAAYRRRVESAEQRGLSRQAARGHRPQEHRTRETRARETGRLTEAEKRWLKAQQRRINFAGSSEAGKQRWDAAVAAFTAMTPDERWAVRIQQLQRQKNRTYGAIYSPHYGDELSPLYLSSRSGLR